MAKRRITQETFDAAVRENMEEFEMDPDEALREAVEQFESQGKCHSWLMYTDCYTLCRGDTVSVKIDINFRPNDKVRVACLLKLSH